VTSALLTLALLAQPEARVGPLRMHALAVDLRTVARSQGLSEALMGALLLAESGGRNVVARGRGAGRRGCDVGVMQIHVPGCTPAKVRRFLGSRAAMLRAAVILHRGKRLCAEKPGIWYCRRGWWWARYNPGSRVWARRVVQILRRIKEVYHGWT